MYRHDPLDRIAIFIDGENIHYSAKHLNIRLDYLKLCDALADGRRLLRASFYTAVSGQSEGKIDFINFLRLNGFHVVARELRGHGGEGEGAGRGLRGHLDLQMAVDVLELLPRLDAVVICTGDGDFVPLLEAAARRGCHVELCALREMTSTELIAAADEYVDLGALKERVLLQRETRSEAPAGLNYDAVEY